MLPSYTDIAKEAKAKYSQTDDSIPLSSTITNDNILSLATNLNVDTTANQILEAHEAADVVSVKNQCVAIIQRYPGQDEEDFNNFNQFPVELKTMLDLSAPPRYLQRQYITPQNCSLQSERILTMCEKDQYRIASIDLVKGNVTRKNIAVDSAIMSPFSNIIAVRAGEVLQVIDLEFNNNLKSCTFVKTILHWKWISSNTIALVTPSHVYHWYIEMSATVVNTAMANTNVNTYSQTANMHGNASLFDAPPVKIFEIDASLIKVVESHYYAFDNSNANNNKATTSNQEQQFDLLVSYQVSDDFKWSILSIKRFASSVAAGKSDLQTGGHLMNNNHVMQLYSMEQRFSQIQAGYIGIFSIVYLPQRVEPSGSYAQILCWIVETTAVSASTGTVSKQFRLVIREVGRGKTAPGGVFSIPPQLIPISAATRSSYPTPPVSEHNADHLSNTAKANAMSMDNTDSTCDSVAIDNNIDDYIHMLEVSKAQGVVYLFSKRGCILIFAVLTGKLLYNIQTINEMAVLTTEHRYIGGIIVIMDTGKVVHIGLNQDKLQRNNPALYSSIYNRLIETSTNTFNRLVLLGDIQGSCRVAAYSPYQILRTSATIRTIQKLFSPAWQPVAIYQYYSILMADNGILNSIESIKYAKFCIRNNMIVLLENSFYAGKITITQELALMLIKIPLITNLGFIMNQHLQNSSNSVASVSGTLSDTSVGSTSTTVISNNFSDQPTASILPSIQSVTSPVTNLMMLTSSGNKIETVAVIDTLVSKQPVADPDYLVLYKNLQQLSMHFSSIGSVQKCIQLRDHYKIHLEEAMNEKQYSLVAGMGTKLSKLDSILNTYEMLKRDITHKCEEYLRAQNWDELLFFGYLHEQISKLEITNNVNDDPNKLQLTAIDLSLNESSHSSTQNSSRSSSTSPTPSPLVSYRTLSNTAFFPSSPPPLQQPPQVHRTSLSRHADVLPEAVRSNNSILSTSSTESNNYNMDNSSH